MMPLGTLSAPPTAREERYSAEQMTGGQPPPESVLPVLPRLEELPPDPLSGLGPLELGAPPELELEPEPAPEPPESLDNPGVPVLPETLPEPSVPVALLPVEPVGYSGPGLDPLELDAPEPPGPEPDPPEPLELEPPEPESPEPEPSELEPELPALEPEPADSEESPEPAPESLPVSWGCCGSCGS